ncbi:unnamed protein product [Phytophthora fragariaefolia]|uniref:Unnamed protein product n=1 Tax=Phytophthora fragariaefolia TaxID=1490495 RepID=A0A9W6WT67_9STRA|nr:unnamed protein product [Phytophthora fragariaefolia]
MWRIMDNFLDQELPPVKGHIAKLAMDLQYQEIVPFCVDSEADRCCVGEVCVKRLKRLNPDILLTKQDESGECKMADAVIIFVEWTMKLRLRLRTIAGMVHVAELVECLLIPGSSGEFLLGNELLLLLGIGVERQLDLLAEPTDANDVEFDDQTEPQWGVRLCKIVKCENA